MSSEERHARSLALEKAYVHDVYDQIAPHFTDTRYRAWPRVKQFLLDLEPASLVADVGCGNGKYLDANREVTMIGSDRCSALSEAARARNHEVVTCDNLQLPFRDETFDAALSVAVIHHFATTDRRVAALKELARVLRIGGKVLITVWAMEQRHRKFDSQDVLVPWHEPVKSSSEDRASSVERELTSTTTSDDDVLVYHAYSHISDSEAANASHRTQGKENISNVNRRRQKFRNGRGRYRSAGSFDHCNAGGNSRSSSELSSPNETCYSFVKRALQKLSSSNSSNTAYSTSSKSNARHYFYRSCRKPWTSTSMEFGANLDAPQPDSSRNELYHQSSLESECPDQANDDDVPIELRHLEGYESCTNCGSPVREMNGLDRCETNICASCLPIDTDSGKKSRSLGDFFNMIPKLLRAKKIDKEPLSDLHKRISTASDPREYVVKSRDGNVNGIVRSKSTVSFMSRLEEIMSFSASSEKNDMEPTNSAQVSKPTNKPSRLPSLTVSSLIDGECPVIFPEADRSTNPRRYNSPADALRKLRQDVSLDESVVSKKNKAYKQPELEDKKPPLATTHEPHKPTSEDATRASQLPDGNKKDVPVNNDETTKSKEDQEDSQESHLSSYYSMPELYKLYEDQATASSVFPAQRQRHISFYEQAQTIMARSERAENSGEINSENHETTGCRTRGGTCMSIMPQRALVKRSLSVDTGDSSISSNHCPRRFSASAAQGVLASALRTYSLPRSSSRGSSVKSDTSVDSEESIVSVIPRKGNSITSDTSVDSEESMISVIQRSTSEIETLVRESNLRNNISRLGSRSARASPVTVLSSQTSSAESSPPQSGKNDGTFPGTGAVIDQLLQQQQHQMSLYSLDGVNLRQDASEYMQRTRRAVLRPSSDSKIEDRYSSSFDDGIGIYRAASKQASGSNRNSLESDDQIIKEEDEKCCEHVPHAMESPKLPPEKKEQKVEVEIAELSRTPSPIGPFKYIYDPLLTDSNPEIFRESSETLEVSNEYLTRTPTESNGLFSNEPEPVSNCTMSDKTSDEACDIISPIDDICSEESELQRVAGETTLENSNFRSDDDNRNDINVSPTVEAPRTSTEAERHEKLRKLSQRLENLGLSSELLKSFYMSSEESEDTFAEGPESQNGKQADDVSSENAPEDESRSDPCHTDNTQEKSDEDSAIDESLKTVIHDVKSVALPPSSSQNTLFKDDRIPNENGLLQVDSNADPAEADHHDQMSPNPSECKSSDEATEQKINIRNSVRKKLKRSCVTIDEVECREVASSEDTSPSSSASLEWNDFDKAEACEAQTQNAGNSSAKSCRRANLSNFSHAEEYAVSSPEDVNVAETENKFNVFLDKEICVFFETPPSSIGKSASSSSNATDFSTTSDRIRGVMQREKSDDRSSKESDSDNLSKMSDLEPKSDSAFSEDFPRKTSDLDSSYADLTDMHRSKIDSLQSWNDYDGASTSKDKHSWVLDNIDEISDDDRDNDIGARTMARLRRGWSHEDRVPTSLYENTEVNSETNRNSFEDSSPNQVENLLELRALNQAMAGAAAAAPSSVYLPVVVPEANSKSSDDGEVPTDILAAFVETISDLTSVFGELYPRHEGKFEDVSSDDSMEISSFERILTSQEPQPAAPKKEEDVGNTDAWFNASKSAPPAVSCSNQGNSTPASSAKKGDGHVNISKNVRTNGSMDMTPLNNSVSKSNRHQRTSHELKYNIQRQESEESSSLAESLKEKFEDAPKANKFPKKHVEDLDLSRRMSAKPKLLNRSSQSVCTDRFRHDSVEDEFSSSKTQSAPCSPRLKLRQKSVEEVLSGSKAELSRNSSLSQSTSQESLPGNEMGGLMAYHRYYHVFRQGELDSLIENYVENLHIIASYYDHANWCVVAEKVQVWTI